MKVLITGSQGFIGQNLKIRLRELKSVEILEFHRGMNDEELKSLVGQVDFIFHLAGVNRPQNESEFSTGNLGLTSQIAETLRLLQRPVPLLYTSSTQAEKNNEYGLSKRQAEESLLKSLDSNLVYIYRLPNVFGKWSKPNYNSAVATFCYNISQGKPIQINDPNAPLNLVYIDDVVSEFITTMQNYFANSKAVSAENRPEHRQVQPIYKTTVGELAKKIQALRDSRLNLVTEHVGVGFDRALHATYLSFLKPEQFSYGLIRHSDKRGVFVEMLKTKESGQFSFFTAGIGITRGGHYHHTKTEKFLILKGKAKYKFKNIITNEFYELDVDAQESKVVETIPGWSHDITNTGDEELVVMLWANEIFDPKNPDTIGHEVKCE